MRLFCHDPDTTRVLVVEDEAVTAELLKLILLEAGYEVEHVAEGVAARARIEQGGFDLVLLDLSLPGIDGLELCRQIRTAAALDDIHLPILMVTARVSVRDRCAGLAAGADDYVLKPFDAEELLARVGVWLRVRAAAQASRAAFLQQEAARQEAERQAMAARLEGVTLAAREITDLLGNALQAPVGAIGLLREEAVLPPDLQELLQVAAEGLENATTHLHHLKQVVRVATKETPMGPALDLKHSIR